MKHLIESLLNLFLVAAILLVVGCNGCGQKIMPPSVPQINADSSWSADANLIPRTRIVNSSLLIHSDYFKDDSSFPFLKSSISQKHDITPIWQETPLHIFELDQVPDVVQTSLREYDLQPLLPPNLEYKKCKLGYVVHTDYFFVGCHLIYVPSVHKTEDTYSYFPDIYGYSYFPDMLHPKYDGTCRCYAPLVLTNSGLVDTFRYPILPMFSITHVLQVVIEILN